MSICFHCGESVAPGSEVHRQIADVQRIMCCVGCATVASIIYESGLEAYYKNRTTLPDPVDRSNSPNQESFTDIFDDSLVHDKIVTRQHDKLCTTQLIVQNMHCPTCVWLIEKRLGNMPGIHKANVVFRSQKLTVRWNSDELSLSQIVRNIQLLGYSVVPYSQTALANTVSAQHRDLLKRLGVAGIFGMQIMVVAVALYASEWSSIDAAYEELFRRLSLLFVLPILFYSAAPIFVGAVRDIRHLSATMDVPIALGLLIAFAASVYATLSSLGEIYYDSIAMFVFSDILTS